MFCIIAFIVLSILGIFSASNRELAKEALDCVFRRVTLRPCTTGFDEKMKAKILGIVLVRSEVAARVINKNFELLSWVFFILLMGSSIWSVRGVYLFYVTGSCNGLNGSSFCVFDPKGINNQVSTVSTTCNATPTTVQDLTLKGINLKGFPVKNETSPEQIVMIGCYSCDYTRKAYPMIIDLVNKFHVGLTFLHYPVKEKTDYLSKVGYCVYQVDQDRYWKLNDILFATDKTKLEDSTYIQSLLANQGLNAAQIETCAESSWTEDIVKMQMDEIVKTHFYGTPTVFIGNEAFVGPKPYRVYAIALEGLLYWLK